MCVAVEGSWRLSWLVFQAMTHSFVLLFKSSVSNPSLPTSPLSLPTEKKTHNYNQDYVCVCVCERLKSREIRESRSRCIPFSLCVFLAVDYIVLKLAQLSPSIFA